MLTIHHPFPLLKAGISGIAVLATGFYGTLTMLHVVNDGNSKTTINQSKTTGTQSTTKASADTSAGTSSSAQQKDKALRPIATGTLSTPNNFDDNDSKFVAQPQPAAAVNNSASGSTSVQLQPAQNVTSVTAPAPVSSPTQTTTSIPAPTTTTLNQSPLGTALPTVQSTINTTQSILP